LLIKWQSKKINVLYYHRSLPNYDDFHFLEEKSIHLQFRQHPQVGLGKNIDFLILSNSRFYEPILILKSQELLF